MLNFNHNLGISLVSKMELLSHTNGSLITDCTVLKNLEGNPSFPRAVLFLSCLMESPISSVVMGQSNVFLYSSEIYLGFFMLNIHLPHPLMG